MKKKNYNLFCESKKCPNFIKWDFGYGKCFSCIKVGQSENINEYPEDCNFFEEINNLSQQI